MEAWFFMKWSQIPIRVVSLKWQWEHFTAKKFSIVHWVFINLKHSNKHQLIFVLPLSTHHKNIKRHMSKVEHSKYTTWVRWDYHMSKVSHSLFFTKCVYLFIGIWNIQIIVYYLFLHNPKLPLIILTLF